MSRAWIQSFSGREVHPLALRPEQVTFEDVAHALAQKVRFNGHLREMGYSVAQHCCLGAEQIVDPFKLAFLLHEGGEVFLPDVPSPIKPHVFVQYTVEVAATPAVQEKRVTKTWAELEDEHTAAILEALGLSELLPKLDSPEVHAMDVRMLMTEKRDLMGPGPGRAWSTAHVQPLPIKIDRVWSPEEAEREFTLAYKSLRGLK